MYQPSALSQSYFVFKPDCINEKIAILLLDDDPIFLRAMERLAQKFSVELVSVSNVDSFLRTDINNFQCAIVDYDLANFTGVEVSEYLQVVSSNLPVILTSCELRAATQEEPWPTCIHGFVHKDLGLFNILDAALRTLESSDVYHNFSNEETTTEKFKDGLYM